MDVIFIKEKIYPRVLYIYAYKDLLMTFDSFHSFSPFVEDFLGPEKGKSKSEANCSLKYESESERVSCGADVQLARDQVGGLIQSGC